MSDTPFGPLRLVLLQGATLCNLNCGYCYIPARQRSLNLRMPEAVLARVFENVFRSPFLTEEGLDIQWHDGEPLTAPIAYYQSAVDCLERLRDRLLPSALALRFQITTNGTLITPEWCRFFKQHGFRVAVSCDGPELLHRTNRPFKGGRSSFSAVVRGIELLQDEDVPHHVLTVVTPETLKNAEELMGFFIEHRIRRVGFLPLVRRDPQAWSDTDEEREAFRRFWRKVIEISEDNPGAVAIRELEMVLTQLVYGNRLGMDESRPLTSISVDTQGNFSTFSPELLSVPSSRYDGFTLGNLLEDRLEAVLSSSKFRRVYRDVLNGVEDCRVRCDHFDSCVQRRPSNSLLEKGTFEGGETAVCRFSQLAVMEAVQGREDTRGGEQIRKSEGLYSSGPRTSKRTVRRHRKGSGSGTAIPAGGD